MNHISYLPLILGELGAFTALLVAHQDAQAACVARPNNLTSSNSGTKSPLAD